MFPVPRYKELGVKPIWSFVKEVPELLKCFPDLEDDELPDRSFLWGILWTKKSNEWAKLLENARKGRGKQEDNNEELIEIDPEILAKLLSAPIQNRGKYLIIYYCWFKQRKEELHTY